MHAHASGDVRRDARHIPAQTAAPTSEVASLGVQRAMFDPAHAAPADVLAVQRTLGNRATNRLVSTHQPEPVIQRKLDEDFKHGGVPTPDELAKCKAFAHRVSDIVDQAYDELLTGKIGEWKGEKITTFLTLLRRGSPMALPHVGNAVEERVYELMKKADLGLPWTPQFAEAMGGASKPDIVINLDSGHEALIDVTSDRGHILRKVGGWTTSERYVYVAEAYFPSVTAGDLPNIKTAIKEGGIGKKEARALKQAADEERERKVKARQEEVAEAREFYNQYSSFAEFTREEFGGSKAEAADYLREYGLGSLKGVPKLKGKRKASEDTLKQRRQLANKQKKLKVAAKGAESVVAKPVPLAEVPGWRPL